jgi:hypothetical protein
VCSVKRLSNLYHAPLPHLFTTVFTTAPDKCVLLRLNQPWYKVSKVSALVHLLYKGPTNSQKSLPWCIHCLKSLWSSGCREHTRTRARARTHTHTHTERETDRQTHTHIYRPIRRLSRNAHAECAHTSPVCVWVARAGVCVCVWCVPHPKHANTQHLCVCVRAHTHTRVHTHTCTHTHTHTHTLKMCTHSIWRCAGSVW